MEAAKPQPLIRTGTDDPAPPTAKAPIGSLRALWPFVRRHRALFVAWLVALACSSAATLSLPMAVRHDDRPGLRAGGGDIDRAFVLLFVVASRWRWPPPRASSSSRCWANAWSPTCANACTPT